MRFKHIDDPVCPACEDKLKQAHPLLGLWFRNEVKPNFPDAHISWSFRGRADQETMFILKRTELHFPDSPHNKTDLEGNACSAALDLFRQDETGKGFWEKEYFAKIDDHNELKKQPILWGGHFKHLGDSDHFQLDLLEFGNQIRGD